MGLEWGVSDFVSLIISRDAGAAGPGTNFENLWSHLLFLKLYL